MRCSLSNHETRNTSDVKSRINQSRRIGFVARQSPKFLRRASVFLVGPKSFYLSHGFRISQVESPLGNQMWKDFQQVAKSPVPEDRASIHTRTMLAHME